MVDTTKAKPKKISKKHISPEEKYLTKMWKLVFSSLTARSCNYAYLFPGTNRIILTNSTSTKTKNELKKDLIVDHEAHGDRLMSFSDANLSIHVVDVKDPIVIQKLKSLVGIPNPDPRERVWCLMTTPLMSFINSTPMNDLRAMSFGGPLGETYLHLVPKGRKMEKKNLIGFDVVNYHVVQLLWQYLQNIPNLWTEEHQKSHIHIVTPIDINPVAIGRIYGISIPFGDIKDSNGNKMYPDAIPIQQVIGIEGLSTVSLKEFVKKIMDKPFRLDQYLWMFDNTRLLMMTLFENEMMIVWSIRPNLFITPMRNTIQFVPFEQMPQPTYT